MMSVSKTDADSQSFLVQDSTNQSLALASRNDEQKLKQSLGDFFSYPREIRDLIWGFVLDFKTLRSPDAQDNMTALLKVSKQIRKEGLPMLYATNTFGLVFGIIYEKTWFGSLVATTPVLLFVETSRGRTLYEPQGAHGDGTFNELPPAHLLKLIRNVRVCAILGRPSAHVRPQIDYSSYAVALNHIWYNYATGPMPLAGVEIYDDPNSELYCGKSVAERFVEALQLMELFGVIKSLQVHIVSCFAKFEDQLRINKVITKAFKAYQGTKCSRISLEAQDADIKDCAEHFAENTLKGAREGYDIVLENKRCLCLSKAFEADIKRNLRGQEGVSELSIEERFEDFMETITIRIHPSMTELILPTR